LARTAGSAQAEFSPVTPAFFPLWDRRCGTFNPSRRQSRCTRFRFTCQPSTGLVFEAAGGVVGVMGFTVADQLITEIDFVVNPEKLHRVIAPSLTLGKQT
jgi:hypothetical protein